MSGPMSGVRIVEVADYVFVPAAAGVLSDWGADVIKIEHYERGDLMRGLRTFHPGAPEDIGFNLVMEQANRGKRSLGLNLGSEEGRQVLYSLVRSADVFLTSKLTPTRQKLLFDVEQLREQNPNLIYVRGTGRGVRGPEAADGGFDALDFWYRSGISMGAKPAEVDNPPGMPAGAFGDNTGGMYIAGGISAALFRRATTGEPSVLDVSLLASGMWTYSAGIGLSSLFGTPTQQPPVGTRFSPMTSNYATSDGRFIALCCLQGFRFMPHLLRVLGVPELAFDERFSTLQAFQANQVQLGNALAAEFVKHTYLEVIEMLQKFEGQWAPVQNSVEVASDEQAASNGYLGTMTTSTGRKVRAVRPPVQFDETPSELGQSPAFNEHCDEVLVELGYSQGEIIDLKVKGAVA